MGAAVSKPLSILLVEDEQPLAATLTRILESAAHIVTHALSGRAAVDLMEDRQFDVILTDIVMPDGDGLEVALAARRWQPQARIIAMSGGSTRLEAGYCLQLAEAVGSRHTLLKPFTREQLLAAIGNSRFSPARLTPDDPRSSPGR